MDLAEQLFRKVLLVVVDILDTVMHVDLLESQGFIMAHRLDLIIRDEVFSLVVDGCCSLGQADIMTFLLIIIRAADIIVRSRWETHPLHRGGSVDRVFVQRGVVFVEVSPDVVVSAVENTILSRVKFLINTSFHRKPESSDLICVHPLIDV